jgi:hypothetical protein
MFFIYRYKRNHLHKRHNGMPQRARRMLQGRNHAPTQLPIAVAPLKLQYLLPLFLQRRDISLHYTKQTAGAFAPRALQPAV